MIETIILFIACIVLMFSITSIIVKTVINAICFSQCRANYEHYKTIVEFIIAGLCIAYIIYFCN